MPKQVPMRLLELPVPTAVTFHQSSRPLGRLKGAVSCIRLSDQIWPGRFCGLSPRELATSPRVIATAAAALSCTGKSSDSQPLARSPSRSYHSPRQVMSQVPEDDADEQ